MRLDLPTRKNGKYINMAGFSLIELLIAIIIIIALAIVVIVALNPAKRIQDARNAQRTAAIRTILTAANAYIADNKGMLPPSISGGVINTDYQIGNGTCGTSLVANGCNTSSTRCANLGADLTKYLQSMLIDPLGSPTANAANTGYAISYDANNIITVKACYLEGGVGSLPLFDSSSTAQHQAPPSSPIIWNHTMTSQSNSIIVVTVAYSNTGFNSTGVTYNGLPLTEAGVMACPGGCISEIWYRVSPSSGTHQVSITTAASSGSIVAGSSSYYNINQITPFGTITTNSGHSKGFSQVAPTAVNQLVVDSVASDDSGYTIGAGQTLNYLDGTAVFGSSSYEVALGASTTMDWNNSHPDNWAEIILPLNPVNTAVLSISR